jgi:hypothetical protein
MIKTLFIFVVFAAVFAGVIYLFREMTGKERWEVIKLVGYAMVCSLASILFLATLVVVF